MEGVWRTVVRGPHLMVDGMILTVLGLGSITAKVIMSNCNHWDNLFCFHFYGDQRVCAIQTLEEDSETLIDDNADTCVNLTGTNGCGMDQVFVLLCFGMDFMTVLRRRIVDWTFWALNFLMIPDRSQIYTVN